ncbi:4'-phosphopantetheinyl transferase family protein [Segetibacter aerophilus]|uniref:4'-phosphopantetheinyl transferase n=1 Tax=Segetibacter aerophilus TaxID=670293 RepID=A0A512BCZ1_9BACT|nr:4'-phosphopantetheinyl transferase superfamily protein [Segetibacter aerophilus]GEO09794.1 4'-phosphopantetheinyl transferase [Segetibacter aerophilus]
MIKAFYIENKKQLTQEVIDTIEALIGPAEKRKASLYRRWQDKQAYLLGKLLIAEHLEKNGYHTTLLQHLSYTKSNRPFIKTLKGDFNVSHSGDFVICAFSDAQMVGVDIERIQVVDFKDFSNILNNNDEMAIKNADDKYASFFKIWSAKEAILKADGCGLVDDIYKLELDGNVGTFNNKRYYLKEFNIAPSYSSCLASPSPIESFVIERVHLESL